MPAKCEAVMNCSEKFIGICKIQIWLLNKEYLRDHRCARTNMATKCETFESQLTLHRNYKHMWSVQSYCVNTESKICLPNK